MTARTARWLAVVSVAAFAAFHLAMLADFGRRHADEHLYTDAAIGMVEQGDLATPRAADGTPRFHKPLLTYWVLAASFRLLGVGLVASRLPFLLAAVLLAWLTWRAALVWSPDPATALLALVILLAHPETTQLATRATPDVLLCLFLTGCLLGISRLAVEDRPSPDAARWVWLGTGLAVATKGLPGLLALLYGGAFLATRRRLRELLRPGAVTLGAAMAAAGLAPPWLAHGGAAVSGLYADQLATRAVARSAAWVLRNAVRQLGSVAVELLPWTVLLAASGRALARAFRGCTAPVLFGLGWTGLLLVVSAIPAFTRPRYTAPALPALAVACAMLFGALGRAPGSAARLRLLTHGVLLLVALGGLVLALAGSRIATAWVVAGTLVAVAAALALRAARDVAPLIALGVVVMLASGVVQVLVRPMVSESPAPALVACLTALGPEGGGTVLVGKVGSLASDLRLASGGRLAVATAPDLATLLARSPAPGVVVAPAGIARRLESEGWRLEPCGREVRGQRWTPRDYWHLVRTGDLDAVLAAKGRSFFVARRVADLTQGAGAVARQRKSTGRHRPARSSRTRSSIVRMAASNSVATTPMKLTRCESLPPNPA